ncbi:hypothetical protein BDQ17DRAFT_1492719 [Cyathus striatus]|nr:hypothetical protein BDQ17DRAFT_1492719 [Cyathus striatus]
MNWYISRDSCFDGTSDSSCGPVNIYFDTDSGDIDWTEFSPVFTWNGSYISQKNSVFYTTLSLEDYGTTNSYTSIQNYPFDIYGVRFYIYGMENTTNVTTTVNIVVDYTYGVALTRPGISGFETTSDTSFGDYISEGIYINSILLQRSGLIKAYVISIVVGIWLITFVFLGSVMKIVFGYGQPKEALAVPIATLFAFTSLRGTMPGAPSGFGTVIDFVGILPCLTIITISGVILFGYMVLSNREATAIGAPFRDEETRNFHENSTCRASSAEPLPMPYKAPPSTNSGVYELVHPQAQDLSYELQDRSDPQSD